MNHFSDFFWGKPEVKIEEEPPFKTTLRLEILRHSKKENDPTRPNEELLLTSEGRDLAHEKGVEFNPDYRVSVAGASPMDRAAETAMLVMSANEDKIATSDSLAEMEEKISEELKFGKKMYRDERLGFNLDGPIRDTGLCAFKTGRYLEWLVNYSDQEALEKNDLISTSYLRQAANIAELVQRYQKIATNFNRLALAKKEQGKEFPDHLERYLVSHQSVAESFLAEVIKEQQGEAAQSEFIAGLKNGWRETEGISFNIINQEGGQIIKASYPEQESRREIEIQPGTLQTILDRRAEFEKMFKK